MEGQGWIDISGEKSYWLVVVAWKIIVSAPVQFPFLWTLDLEFWTWILVLNFGLGFGTWIWDWTWAWQLIIEGHRGFGHRRAWKVMEGQWRSRKVMDGHFPSLDWHFRWEKLGVVVACRIILSTPVPFPFQWTLDFGFETALGLDN